MTHLSVRLTSALHAALNVVKEVIISTGRFFNLKMYYFSFFLEENCLSLIISKTVSSGTAPPSFGAHLQLLGCWQDEVKMIPKRALESAEGKIDYLEDRYKDREDAIKKCYDYALSIGRNIFAIQDGGQCFTAGQDDSYDTFGSSSSCNKEDGKGGPMANEVYAINSGKLLTFNKTCTA